MPTGPHRLCPEDCRELKAVASLAACALPKGTAAIWLQPIVAKWERRLGGAKTSVISRDGKVDI